MFATKLNKLLIFICSFSFINLINAAEIEQKPSAKLFQIEIIAFQINEKINSNENFPHYPALPEYTESVELSASDEQLENYMLLPPEFLKLNREENLISKKSNYQILFHYSWLQGDSSSQKVHLYGPNEEQSQYVLNGTIQVKKGYYYSVALNLDLQPPQIALAPNSPKHFVLNTKRKLKRNEMHYIDHPKFGLLIQIMPYKS